MFMVIHALEAATAYDSSRLVHASQPQGSRQRYQRAYPVVIAEEVDLDAAGVCFQLQSPLAVSL